jgi:hypothetical protein
MAKSKGKHKKPGFTISVSTIAGFVPLVLNVRDGYRFQGWEGAGREAVVGITGYDTRANKWSPEPIVKVMGPVLAGMLIHKLANKLGINRMIAKSGIPYIRI